MRLDVLLSETDPALSRTRAKELIERGYVSVNGTVRRKASFDAPEGAEVTVARVTEQYVGRGAYKLEGALSLFSVDPAGKKCIDVGASTGGFTEVLLLHGAASVTAVDAGHGQLAPSLKEDARVRNVEGCNARYMTAENVGEGYDIGVMDVSFISQTYIFPALKPLITSGGRLITLVKPQFELDAASVGRGVVRKPELRLRALTRVRDAAQACGFCVTDAALSPVYGGDGNVEYLFCLCHAEDTDGTVAVSAEQLAALSKKTPSAANTAGK